MTLLLGLILIGFVFALAAGGSLAGWRTVRVRWWLPTVAALALQLVLYNPPFDAQPWALTFGPYLFILCKATLVGTLLVNALGTTNGQLKAAWYIATLGVALNLAVVTANGGYMPQSEAARFSVRGATLIEESTAQPKLRNVTAMDDTTELAFLGDVVAQPSWLPRSNVVSIGDIFLSSGLALWAFQVTLLVRRAPVRRRQLAEI